MLVEEIAPLTTKLPTIVIDLEDDQSMGSLGSADLLASQARPVKGGFGARCTTRR